MRTKFDSTIAKALASTVLVSSCSPDAGFLQPLSELDNSPNQEFNNAKGVSISLNMNDKMREDLKSLEPLVTEILKDSIAAKDFAANPNMYCRQHGYSLPLEEGDPILNVLVALGNQDIRKALETGNFEEYFHLCRKLNFFNEAQAIQLNSLVKSEEEQKIFEAIALEMNCESLSTRSVAIYGVVTVLIVIAIVVTITVGFANRDDASTLSNEAKDSVCNNTTNMLKINNPEHMIINMWALNHDIDSYQVISGYKRFITKQVIAHLKETNSPVLAKYSEKQISEFLKENMLV